VLSDFMGVWDFLAGLRWILGGKLGFG
jgi:hypothetical protein